jgi:serine-type D-Ala-D-Ala carboxypeptidase/endopeptidase
MKISRSALWMVMLGAACSSSESAPGLTVDASVFDSIHANAADTAFAIDGSSANLSRWQAVESLFNSRSAAVGANDIGLVIWDGSDQKVYERVKGTFTTDKNLAVASASKLVSGLVIFDVIRRGQLSLDATTGQILGWTGSNGAITMRQLLSFTSGLPRETMCTLNPLVTLATCVDTIQTATAVAAPGTRFDYGSTHLHIAARMAEVATGRVWSELFTDLLRAPLGLPTSVAYYTAPRQSIGTINPLIAGGLRASTNDYAKLLALAFHKGTFGGVNVGTPALFDEQSREPFPAATIGLTPLPENRYGLASWLLCDTPSYGCQQLSSPGAFGFTPWYDREAGYYAILGMELPNGQGVDGVVRFAVDLERDLAPLIRAALGR